MGCADQCLTTLLLHLKLDLHRHFIELPGAVLSLVNKHISFSHISFSSSLCKIPNSVVSRSSASSSSRISS